MRRCPRSAGGALPISSILIQDSWPGSLRSSIMSICVDMEANYLIRRSEELWVYTGSSDNIVLNFYRSRAILA